MSIAAHRYVRDLLELCPELTSTQRHVLRELADAAGGETGHVWLSAETLASRTGYHRGTIYRALATLRPYVDHATRDGRTTVWMFSTDREKLSTTSRTGRDLIRTVRDVPRAQNATPRAQDATPSRTERDEPGTESVEINRAAPPPEFYAARDDLRRRWRGAS